MENLTTFFFYFISLILIYSSISMILSKKESYYLSFGLISLIAISAIFYMLNASFNGVLLLLFSTILIIFLFCTMLFTKVEPKIKSKKNKNSKKIILFGCIGIFFIIFVIALINNYYEQVTNNIVVLSDLKLLANIYEVGKQLSSNYIIGLKIIGILLFSTLIGIHLISNFKEKGEN